MRAWIVADLGFGDSGKGTVVDWLARAEGARLVVRWNGGGQAGHHVVTADGRRHTFSQIGAGAFVPGVRTWLAAPFVLHPGALAVEAAVLAGKGVPHVLERMTLDERARVSTPFQQAAGRIRELARGDARHGSCGVGFGEAVSDALIGHADTLRAADLRGDVTGALRGQQERKRAELADLRGVGAAEWALLDDPRAPERVIAQWAALRDLRILGADAFAAALRASDVVMEGAQGVLLDETWGFHPHTTWSDCTPQAAAALLAEHGYDGDAVRIGVIRAYATRHGAGPFPTEDAEWSARLPDAVNGEDPWQGPFRAGPLDLELLRYALRVAPVDRIAVTCLDRLRELPDATICTGYEGFALEAGEPGDLAHRERLGARLRGAKPVLERLPSPSDSALLDRVAELGVAPWLASYGPSAVDKRIL